MLSGIRLPDFDALATKTANCLLGFECETESNVAKGTVYGSFRDTPTDARGKSITSNVSTNSANNSAPAQSQDNKAQNNEYVGNARKINDEIKSALEAMAAKNKQQKMNSMSKGPYFLIFIIALLLMGFSLGDDKEE